jgi:hypothetical protein
MMTAAAAILCAAAFLLQWQKRHLNELRLTAVAKRNRVH